MLSPAALWFHYRGRLRAFWLQEILAGAGIAIGVAVAFAVMVTNGSIASSSGEIVRAVVGSSDLQLTSRDTNGLDASVLDDVKAAPSVERAGLLLDQRAVVVGPDGQTGVNLASIDETMAELSTLASPLVVSSLKLFKGMILTRAAAEAIGFKPGLSRREVRLEVRGVAAHLPVAAVLGGEMIGTLATAPIAVLPLETLQSLTGMRGRATRILIEAKHGQAQAARRELAPIAERLNLNLSPADAESRMLKQALGPSDWTTGFFAALAAMLGLLLAFNAMLLTAPDRRRGIAMLRMHGYRAKQVMWILVSQAVALGLVASLVGVAGGVVLATKIVGAPDAGYLAPAFVPGRATMLSAGPAVLAVLGGIVACLAASAPPMFDLRRGRSVDHANSGSEAQGQALSPRTRAMLPLVAAAALAAAAGVLWVAPQLALVAVGLLAVATVTGTPAVFSLLLSVGSGISSTGRTPTLMMSMFSLRATTIRSLALASTGALAVFGTIAIVGARTDLLRGIANYTDDYVSTADLWIVNPVDNQATGPIALPGIRRRVEAVPGVADARVYQGSFLDMRGRRVWVIARDRNDRAMLPASQLVDGDLEDATRAIRAGGAVAISTKLADALGVKLGGRVTVPTPSGRRTWRVVALTTNLGWTPGAIVMRSSDYAAAWGTTMPSAIEVDLTRDANVAATKQAIAGQLGPRSGLRVQTAAERADGINASARQGLDQLRQISGLMLIGAVLAMATAMSAAIWQRRASLASLRIHGHSPRQLWKLLLVESSVVLAAGCVAGTIIGVLGQVGIDQFLSKAIGFPVSTVPGSWQTFETFLLVLAAALVIVAIPGWRASKVPPALGLGER